jgi:hypothetical protein
LRKNFIEIKNRKEEQSGSDYTNDVISSIRDMIHQIKKNQQK